MSAGMGEFLVQVALNVHASLLLFLGMFSRKEIMPRGFFCGGAKWV